MSTHILYLLFAGALIIDSALVPTLGIAVWMPYLTLSLLPAISLFAPPKHLYSTTGIYAFALWLTTRVNLGIIVLALGALALFEESIVRRFFSRTAWQMPAIAALGVVFFFLIVGGASHVLNETLYDLSSLLSLRALTTYLCAAGVTYVAQRSLVTSY